MLFYIELNSSIDFAIAKGEQVSSKNIRLIKFFIIKNSKSQSCILKILVVGKVGQGWNHIKKKFFQILLF